MIPSRKVIFYAWRQSISKTHSFQCTARNFSNSANLTNTSAMAAAHDAASIASEPSAGQLVEHYGKTYSTVKEGLAYILVPPNARTATDPQASAKAGT